MKFLPPAFAFLLISANALACGGEDISDAQITSLEYVQKAKSKISSTYNQPVKIESIVRSGNSIINLEKKEVARVRCKANFINVFFIPVEKGELLCSTTFQMNRDLKTANFSGIIPGIECRKSIGAQSEWIDLEP